MIGTTVSHYRILELLGGGGKGVVYKAQDLRLQRFVALKFLSGTVGEGDEEVQRFLREARAASVIEHPNLCTVYEIDETDEGQLFIAMAFSEGETLKAKIERGPLELEPAVDFAVQVAGGLGRAHERGIIHRDVKPANLIVTPEGQVKIVDFGIAHLSGQTRLTRAGSMVGTAAYMSPEQLRSAPADPRMDIWALGVVLYEMVTGQAPFRGEDRVLLYSILNRQPAPMNSLRPGVPSALERIVSRALAKNPRDRYPSLEEMRADLTSLRWSSAPAEERDPTPTPAPPSRSPASSGPSEPATGTGTPPTAQEPGAPPRPDGAGPAGPRPGGPRLDRSISHYRIGQRLGGGGMGVVYKAEDTLLQRTVALKFLPRRLTLDPEGKDRFLQEARTASSLDHPNLCTIYEVGETADGQLFLAMPYYDGETLRKRLERGPLSVIEAVDIAAQVAQGLARVHRRGIVHRDIKPANLMVTGDGIAKILDFGIAKLVSGAVASPAEVGLGTPAYMSPEQASGGEVDPRSDLWSLGVVLYEMLAGRRPFRGDQEQAVIYALLHDEPEPVARLRPDVPPELERILGRLLAKEAERRYATADEAFADLRRLFGEASGAYFPPPPAEAARVGRRRAWRTAGSATVAVAAALGLFLAFRPPPPAAGGNPFEDASSQKLTFDEGREWQAAISPDGSGFAYVRLDGGDWDIFYQEIEGDRPPVNLTAGSPTADLQPAFSPDGRSIAFSSEGGGGGIFLTGLDGSAPRRLAPEGAHPSWSPDGRSLVYSTGSVFNPASRTSVSELWRVDVATTSRRRLATGDAVQPSWSPSGKRIAYWGVVDARRVLWTIPAEGGEAVPAVEDESLNWNPVWSPDGRFLYFASDRSGSMNLWRIAIDEDSGKVQGEARPLKVPSSWSAWVSLSQDGRRILYTADDTRSHLVKTAFDPESGKAFGPIVPINDGSQSVRSGQVSPDGEWVAFDSLAPQEDLYLIRLDGSGLKQLTRDAFKDRNPRWSPDGRRLAFYSDRSGLWQAWAYNLEDGRLEQLTDFKEPVFAPVWGPGGDRLIVPVGWPDPVPSLIDLSLPLPAREREPLPQVEKTGEVFAPNSWLADPSLLAGHSYAGLFFYSFPQRRLVSLHQPTGYQPLWLGKDKILFLDSEKIRFLDLATGQDRDVLVPAAHSVFSGVSVSADRKTLVAVRGFRAGDIWLLTID